MEVREGIIMAHSSGGGSYGGGCHGGYRGGGNASGSNVYIIRANMYKGAKRYSYVDKKGVKKYFYCQGNLDNYSTADLKLSFVVCIIFILAMLFYPDMKPNFFRAQKLSNPCSEIVIEDRLNVIEDSQQLLEELTVFYEKTGVTPGVVTVAESDWSEQYNNLEDYAMDQYYALYEDEVHWLIVYSASLDEEGKPRSIFWSFEGIIGDDTGDSISLPLCERLTRKIYNNLRYKENPGEAIGDGFQNLLKHRWPGITLGTFVPQSINDMMVFVTAIMVFGPLLFLYEYYNIKIKYRNAVLDEERPEMQPADLS